MFVTNFLTFYKKLKLASWCLFNQSQIFYENSTDYQYIRRTSYLGEEDGVGSPKLYEFGRHLRRSGSKIQKTGRHPVNVFFQSLTRFLSEAVLLTEPIIAHYPSSLSVGIELNSSAVCFNVALKMFWKYRRGRRVKGNN